MTDSPDTFLPDENEHLLTVAALAWARELGAPDDALLPVSAGGHPGAEPVVLDAPSAPPGMIVWLGHRVVVRATSDLAAPLTAVARDPDGREATDAVLRRHLPESPDSGYDPRYTVREVWLRGDRGSTHGAVDHPELATLRSEELPSTAAESAARPLTATLDSGAGLTELIGRDLLASGDAGPTAAPQTPTAPPVDLPSVPPSGLSSSDTAGVVDDADTRAKAAADVEADTKALRTRGDHAGLTRIAATMPAAEAAVLDRHEAFVIEAEVAGGSGLVAGGGYTLMSGLVADLGVAVVPAARRRGIGAYTLALLADDVASDGLVPQLTPHADDAAASTLAATTGWYRVGRVVVVSPS